MRTRLGVTVAEHDRRRRPSSTGDEFGRRGPGDEEAPVGLKNRRAQLGWVGREDDLTFLFKVLSVAKTHPDKKLAEVLHALRPSTYKDNNHKLRTTIAITVFPTLCIFASIKELKDVLRTCTKIEGLAGHEDTGKVMNMKEDDGISEVKFSLQSAVAKPMTTSKDMVSEAIAKLISRLNTKSKIRTLTDKEQLVLSLERQYQDDAGVIAANDMLKSKGHAILNQAMGLVNQESSKSIVLAVDYVLEVAEKVVARELTSAFALIRPTGHHAEYDEPMEFCLFNTVAVAANYLLNERPDLVHRFDYGSFYPTEVDDSHCFIREEASKGYNINVS
uniref:Uncharacterized protein n=1 Tax=Zea mays TaxID=4577 RepID=A0A804PE46_MAIZE